MFKSIILVVLITLFAGCGAPTPPQIPTWFTSPPKDFNLFYAVGSAPTQAKAKSIALVSLREQIKNNLDTAFKQETHKLKVSNKALLSEIMKINTHSSKVISMRTAKIAKSAEFEGKQLVLISISKKELFTTFSRSADKKYAAAKALYDDVQDKVAIDRYVTLKNIMQKYPKLASDAEFKKNALSSFNANEVFIFLNTLDKELKQLQSDVSIYILSDANSLPFVKNVKAAITAEGLAISKKPKSQDSIKLLVTSKTTDEDEYSFKRSSTLIKFTTYNMSREKIKFKQHTFIGKSTKNYREAKAQSAIHLKAKIKKEGIFKFIGIPKK